MKTYNPDDIFKKAYIAYKDALRQDKKRLRYIKILQETDSAVVKCLICKDIMEIEDKYEYLISKKFGISNISSYEEER